MVFKNVPVVGWAPTARKATARRSLLSVTIVLAGNACSSAHAAPHATVTNNAKAWNVFVFDVDAAKERPHRALNLEDIRSREAMRRQTAAALKILRQVPFDAMESHDELVESKDAWCLAAPGKAYLLYVRAGDTAKLRLAAGRYRVTAYDPMTGDEVSEFQNVDSSTLELIARRSDRAFAVVRESE